MKTPLLPQEHVLLSSPVGLSTGGRTDIFPTLAEGVLTLTNERLVFEPALQDADILPLVLPLGKIGAALATWIRLFDLVPIYASLDVLTTAGETIRFAVVRMDARRPREWVNAISSAQAALAPVSSAIGDPSLVEQEFIPAARSASPASTVVAEPALAPVDDRFAWAIVAVPIAGAAFDRWAGSGATIAAIPISAILMLAANVVLSQIDIRRLTASGREAPNGGWALLVPVYLWKRAAILHRPQVLVLAWLTTFALSLFIDLSTDKANLAESACPIVTKIIREQLNGSAACRRVTIADDLGGGLYTGRVLLDNGRELKITIENRGEEIYVQIPPQ